MLNSKSIDKLMIISDFIDKLPINKIKTISIKWNEIENMAVPDLIVEMYETEEENQDNEENGIWMIFW